MTMPRMTKPENFGGLNQIFTLKQDLATRNSARWVWDKSKQGQSRDALTTTRFADNAQRFPDPEIKRQIADDGSFLASDLK